MKPGESFTALIAEDVLRKMFQGDNSEKAKDLMDLMKRKKDEGHEFPAKTPMSHFLRAIFLADPETPIKNIQKVLSFTQVIPSFADFRDYRACVDEMVQIANAITRKDPGEKEND